MERSRRQKKRLIGGILSLLLLAAAIVFVILFRAVPLLPGDGYQIERITLWEDGAARQVDSGDNTDLVRLLADCQQQRVLGGVDRIDGVSLRPDWVSVELQISDGEDGFLLLVGDGECQRRSLDYGGPVYIVSGEEAADKLLENIQEDIK